MNKRQEFFRTAYNVEVPPVPTEYDDKDITPLINQDEVSVICPLNEFGLVSEPLQRALRDDCSPTLRDNLLGMLQDTSTASDGRFASLPDDVRMNLVKLRTCQTPSEMRSYINALSAWLDENNIVDTPTDDTPSDDTPTDDTPSNE